MIESETKTAHLVFRRSRNSGEMTYRYYNEDVWEDLVDSVTMEEAIERLSSQRDSALKG